MESKTQIMIITVIIMILVIMIVITIILIIMMNNKVTKNPEMVLKVIDQNKEDEDG